MQTGSINPANGKAVIWLNHSSPLSSLHSGTYNELTKSDLYLQYKKPLSKTWKCHMHYLDNTERGLEGGMVLSSQIVVESPSRVSRKNQQQPWNLHHLTKSVLGAFRRYSSESYILYFVIRRLHIVTSSEEATVDRIQEIGKSNLGSDPPSVRSPISNLAE